MSESLSQSDWGSTILQINVSSQITIRSQTDAATEVTIEEITQHTKGNDDREVIITEELKSHLKGLLYKRDEKKEQGDPDFREKILLQWERDSGPKRKSYWTLRLRKSLTSTPVPREENQRTAHTATC